MTELNTLGSDSEEKENEKIDADSCCDACTSTLWRNHCVSSQPSPFDNYDMLFNGSREQLILEPSDNYLISAKITPSQNIESSALSGDVFTTANGSSCRDTNCSCHRGADNPTFVADIIMLHRSEDYIVGNSEKTGFNDHVSAAQALMLPVNGQGTEELSDKGQTRFDEPMEMACYSICQNGNRLVVEDLESGTGIVSSDTRLVDLNGIGHPSLNVREAWPDNSSVSTDTDLNDASNQKQLLVCTIHFCTCIIDDRLHFYCR